MKTDSAFLFRLSTLREKVAAFCKTRPLSIASVCVVIVLLSQIATTKLAFSVIHGASLSICALSAVKRKSIPDCLLTAMLTIASVIVPSIQPLYGVVLVVCVLSTDAKWMALPVMTIWLLRELPIGTTAYSPSLVAVVIAAACALRLACKAWHLWLTGLLWAGCVAITFVQLTSPEIRPVFRSPQPNTFRYRAGDNVLRLFPVRAPDAAETDVRVCLYENGPSIPSAGIMLVEHDQVHRLSDVAAPLNWTQPLPWSDNWYKGDQYWLAAIMDDGQLVANLGGTLLTRGCPKLLHKTPEGHVVCLATQLNNTTYIGDSDFWINGLGSYQKNLLGEILRSREYYTSKRILNLAFLVGCLLYSIARTTFQRTGAATAFAIFTVSFGIEREGSGDVRIKGSVYDPHEPSKVSGVCRALADAGLNAVRGGKNAEMLVVGAGHTSTHSGERVILLEPSAAVVIGGKVVRSEELPLGTSAGILDARNLVSEGTGLGPKATLGDTVIVGTGSPAKNAHLLWEH